jgi:rod shape-determining protein MreC
LVRTGLRSVIYGTPRGEALDLRFVPSSADVKVGDELVTSGLDGVFPAGLPVARIAQVDRQADTAFARVICIPIAPVHGPRQLLVLQYQTPMPPSPIDLDGGGSKDSAKNTASAGKKTMKSPEKSAEKSAEKPAAASATAAPAGTTPEPAAGAHALRHAAGGSAAAAQPASRPGPHEARP